MDNMSPQQHQDSHSRGAQQDTKRRMKCQSYRRQSAPSLVLTKALTRSKTISRESFLVPVCPETCPLVQSFLTGSDRSFLLHGHVQLKTGMQKQDRHLFMFNDILVVAKAKSANQFKQKAQVCVCEMWTASCMDEVCEGSTNPERSFVVGWPTCNSVATFSSAEQKERWLSLLKSRIKEEKEREEPKTIPMRVYGKGINSFAVTKTLPVSNSDSTNEVIRLALQQFSIIGNVKDFQLWVISKRDSASYPLIGHEFPFSIQMSHARLTLPLGGGGRDVADRQRVLQVEQLQVYKQCQFILKPRPVEMLQQLVSADFHQKSFKRRRSLIAWAFWRGSSSHLNELSLTGAARGCLFSQPLSAVCVDDALPKPVTDMLTFLYHEGSWTRGIFRRSAGARAVRELRDSLDAGDCHLPLTRDHVFLIAGVFKDFLRRIPGSLLCSEMYEEWLDVLEEEEEEEEQVQDIQRMICRLPKDNTLLLRYLLAMLHGIQGNAHENQMTSFNLAVCIAPSMLWPPGAPASPEVEGEGTKRVCELVKFMIEHCRPIVGEEPSSLYGGPPQRLNTEEMGSGSWTYPLTDSSYDSLENELDNSGSPGYCGRGHLGSEPRHGSLDSILTSLDYDQDPVGRTRGRRLDAPTVDTSSTLESLSLEGLQRQRRCSEPALAHLGKLLPGSDEEDEPFPKPSGSGLGHTHTRRGGYEPEVNLRSERAAALEASSMSLSPTPTSPAPTSSSADSLDSLSDGQARVNRWGLYPTKTPVPVTSVHPDWGTSPKGSPPKDALNKGPLKGCRGLHPNSWLKKDRRLSLTQQDNLEKEEEKKGKAGEKGGGKFISSNHESGKSGQEPHKLQLLKHDLSSPPSHHRSTGSLQFPKPPWFNSSDSQKGGAEEDGACELRQPSLFYKQSGPSLSLFKRCKSQSVEEARNAGLQQRRGSEPGRQVADRASALTRPRLPSDPGLKVSEVDSQGGTTTEARFCITPYAAKVVKNYFSSRPRSNPQSSQQVALSLVGSHRERLKRCSNPKAETDFDQLLFAEESYV